jgi:hypothetical protein|nr:MAG TPA: tail tubular protein [Caudoviricetes sp.]
MIRGNYSLFLYVLINDEHREKEENQMNGTDICNIALAYIGQGRIASIEEESEESAQCVLFYNHLRRKLLSEYRWNFAERKQKLALLKEEVAGWNYVYAYPAQCLIIRKIHEKGNDRIIKKEDWQVLTLNESTKAVCTDVSGAYATYTANVENADMFPDTFVSALAHALASAIAVPLSGSQTMAQLHYQMMQQNIYNAKYQSAIQDNRKTEYPTTYMDGR